MSPHESFPGRYQKNLPQKDFKKKSGHHIYSHHEYNGIKTYISHSAKQRDIAGDLLSSMRKQLRLDSMKQTVALIICPMDKKELKFPVFLGGLADRGVIFPKS
jgi:hypothetical protein